MLTSDVVRKLNIGFVQLC